MKQKRLLIPCFLLFLITLLTLPAFAERETLITSSQQLPDEYLEFLDRLPSDVQETLPDGLFSNDPATVAAAIEEMSHFSYLMRTVLSLVGIRLHDCLSLLAQLAGLVLLSAVLRSVKVSFVKETVARACSFCINLVMLISLLGVGYETLLTVTEYLDTLNKLTAALLPLTGVLYAMGGNVTTAVASSTGLSVFMTVLEQIVGNTVVPFCGLCLAFTVVGSFEPTLRIGSLLTTVKKNYTLILTFLMMLLLAMLSMQTTLAARADTLAMKSAKFAAGNLIPVVGGSVSELLRTVSAGVSYLRGTVGICAVLLLLLLLLPTLIQLLLFRLTWQLGASLADMLFCDSEKRVMDEFASLCGYLIAAVSICSSVVLLALTLFIHCASAIG